MELYQTDESHPSIIGSYLAACTFYATIFHKSPVGASFPVGVLQSDAQHIQEYVNEIVFDSLSTWNIDTTTVRAAFTVNTVSQGNYQFLNTSANAQNYNWFFGDGDTSSLISPTHTYINNGIYTILLVASKDCMNDSASFTMNVNVTSLLPELSDLSGISITPNPAAEMLSIKCTSCLNDSYRFSDILGNTIKSGFMKSNTEIIDVNSLSEGIYMFQIEHENKIYTSRIIKSN
jgi:PKD repeat protein